MATVEGGFSSLSGTGLYSDNTNGRIGIGTSTLNHRLAVDDTGTIGGIKVESDSSQALTVEKQDGTILLRADGSASKVRIDGTIENQYDSTNKYQIVADGGGFRVAPVNNNETGSVRIVPKGNPTGGSLGGYTRAQARVYYTESTSGNIESISLESHYTKDSSSPDVFSDPRYYIKTRAEGTGQHHPLTFQIGGNNVLTLTTDDKAGIGTTTPGYKLEVVGQAAITGGSNPYLLLKDSTPTNHYIQISSGKLAMGNNGSLVIDTAGKVGIGTTGPDQRLTVNGAASKSGDLFWISFSDERLKAIEGSFDAGLDEVMRLNPVRYRYREDNPLGIDDHNQHVGLIAQDVERVIPEAVSKNSKGYLMLSGDPILWTMLNAIKELKAENNELKVRLGEIDKRLRDSVKL